MLMTETVFFDKIYQIAQCYDPDVDDNATFQDLIQLFELMKDKALKFELLEHAFRPEPQLPRINQCDI